MWLVVAALIPSFIIGMQYFGLRSALVVTLSLSTAMLTQAGCNILRKIPFYREQGAAVVTGLLLGLLLPHTAPLWMPMFGAFIAITLGIAVFGGSKNTIFHPVLLARVFLSISYPAIFSQTIWPDGVPAASPLTVLLTKGQQAFLILFEDSASALSFLFFENVSGLIGEVNALVILIGGVILIFARVIDFKIPLLYLATIAIFSLFMNHNPLYHLLTGSLLLGAFFLAPTFSTTSQKNSAKITYGIGCGLLTMLIRVYSSPLEAVFFAILFMNALSPLLDKIAGEKLNEMQD